MSALVFIASITYLFLFALKAIKPNWGVIMFILIIFGFFFINFSYATVNDANRFKYPVEPLIITLSVYYFYKLFLFARRNNIIIKKHLPIKSPIVEP